MNKLIKRYEHSLFVEYFENLQDQIMLNFPGVNLSLGEVQNQIEMALYNSKQRVMFQITSGSKGSQKLGFEIIKATHLSNTQIKIFNKMLSNMGG